MVQDGRLLFEFFIFTPFIQFRNQKQKACLNRKVMTEPKAVVFGALGQFRDVAGIPSCASYERHKIVSNIRFS